MAGNKRHGHRTTVNISLPISTADKLMKLADKWDMTRSGYVAMPVEAEVANQERADKEDENRGKEAA